MSIDIDLKSYYDKVRHHKLLDKLGNRIADNEVMHLLKEVIKTNGKRGIPQGGPLSPLLANLYLNEIDKMLEKAKEVTNKGPYTHLTYARYLDDIVICVDGKYKWKWLYAGVKKRLFEELGKLELPINEEKNKELNLEEGGSFEFLGFEYKRSLSRNKKKGVLYNPAPNRRNRLLEKLRQVLRRFKSQPIQRVIEKINPILRGWLNYFRIC